MVPARLHSFAHCPCLACHCPALLAPCHLKAGSGHAHPRTRTYARRPGRTSGTCGSRSGGRACGRDETRQAGGHVPHARTRGRHLPSTSSSVLWPVGGALGPRVRPSGARGAKRHGGGGGDGGQQCLAGSGGWAKGRGRGKADEHRRQWKGAEGPTETGQGERKEGGTEVRFNGEAKHRGYLNPLTFPSLISLQPSLTFNITLQCLPSPPLSALDNAHSAPSTPSSSLTRATSLRPIPASTSNPP